QALRERGWRPRGLLAVGAAFTILSLTASIFSRPVAGAVVAMIGGGVEKVSLASHQLPGALAEGGLLWMVTAIALDLLRRPGRSAPWVSAALLAFVPIAANRRIAQTFREEEVLAPTAFARTLDRLDPLRRYRVLGESIYREVSPLDDATRGADPSYNQYC